MRGSCYGRCVSETYALFVLLTFVSSSTHPIPPLSLDPPLSLPSPPSHPTPCSFPCFAPFGSIQDLLRPSSSNMQIRESENGVYISGVEEVEVTCVEDCLKLLAVGERNRTVAFTKMNAHSSRSHAIAIITVEKKRRKEAESSDSEAHSGPATAYSGARERRAPQAREEGQHLNPSSISFPYSPHHSSHPLSFLTLNPSPPHSSPSFRPPLLHGLSPRTQDSGGEALSGGPCRLRAAQEVSFETFHNPFPLGKPRLPAFPCAPALPLTAILSGHISQPSDGCLLVLTNHPCLFIRCREVHQRPSRPPRAPCAIQGLEAHAPAAGVAGRDSNLTPLHDLVDPTTGNAKTSLIINVAPHRPPSQRVPLLYSLSPATLSLPPSTTLLTPHRKRQDLVHHQRGAHRPPSRNMLYSLFPATLLPSPSPPFRPPTTSRQRQDIAGDQRGAHRPPSQRGPSPRYSSALGYALPPAAMEVKTKAMVNEEEEYRILTRTLHETATERPCVTLLSASRSFPCSLPLLPSPALCPCSLPLLFALLFAMEVKTKAMVNEEEEYRILTRTLQETIDEHDDRVHSLEVVVYSQEEQLSQAKASLEEQKELVETLQAEREEMEQKLADGVAAVEEEWAAKALQAEREEMEQKLAERVVQWKRSGLPSELAKGGMVRMWLEQAEAEATQRMEEAQQTFTEEGAGDAGQELMAEEASKESDSGEKGNEGGLVDGEGSGDGEEEGSEDWEDGSEVKELLGAFTSVALTHVQVCHPPSSPRSLSHTFSCPVCHPYLACVLPLCGVAFSHCYYRLQNLSKATECLTMERDDMAKELASAREMVQRLEQQLREAQEAKGQQEEALLVASESGDVVQRLEQQLREAQEEKGHLEEALLIASESGDVVQRLEQQLREAQEEKGHLEEALLIASESGDVVQRLEQQLREAQEEKGHLEEALLIASESGDGADGTGAGLQLLMTEKAARQQAEQEVAALRGEMSRGRVKLEETEKKLAQQIEETTQRVEQVRALKAESKRLNELVVATSRALVAGAADAPGRALSSLDYHFCAPKIKT
ncbi:unnamed protein product [Closterium sp. Naga37s-1]|nr:unnamed protein product [Closterium sp. Naga37s-1]